MLNEINFSLGRLSVRSFLIASLLIFGCINADASMVQPYSGCIDCFNFNAPSVLGVGSLASPSVGLIVLDTQSGSFKGYSGVGGWQTLSPGGGLNPAGAVLTFAGANCPVGYVPADGSSYARTSLPDLFAAISTVHGDGSTGASGTSGCPATSGCFNVPDYRGRFLRGQAPVPASGVYANISGSGSATSSNATFTAHGLTNGQKVRMISGALSGLTIGTDYWVIVVDANTLAFATSLANSQGGTKVAVSGTNTAAIQAWRDPDGSTRIAMSANGSTGSNVGSYQADAMQELSGSMPNIGTLSGWTGVFKLLSTSVVWNDGGGQPQRSYAFDASYQARTSSETRPANAYVNYCIKY